MQQFLDYASHHPWYVVAAIAMVLVVAVYEFREARASFGSIGTAEVIRLVNGGALLIDIRRKEDFDAGHIAGARQMASDEIAAGAASLERFKDKAVIAYCETGMTAGAAARHLARLGFKSTYNLRGGLAAWRQENLPLVKS
jgi:rhodanese-related sulfurtransferase